MREYTSRVSEFKRVPTQKAMNGDLMFLFGVTIQDFLYGVTVFMSVAVMPGFLSPFVAITMALVVVISSKKMRAQFPKNYFKHLVWSLGLWNSELRDNPFFISKARFVVLGP